VQHQLEERSKTLSEPAASKAATAKAGVLYALAAFFMWGLVVPLHFKLLSSLPPLQILAYRIVWASLFASGLIVYARQVRQLTDALVFSRRLALLCLSAGLIGVNWLVYIWAVNNGHLVQTSLG
jgi:chloramphenicol-sensitive protein RarD